MTIDASTTTTLKLLARGRSPQWVADATGSRASLVEEVGRRYGWPDLDALQANLDGAGVVDDAPRHEQPPQRGPAMAHTSSSAPRPTPPATSTQNLGSSQPGKLELLLARAGKHDTAQVRAARNAVLTACTRLESALHKVEQRQAEKQQREAEKAAARSRVALLEKQLRDAKAALRGAKAEKSPTPRPQRAGEDPKVVRAWAAEHGIECPGRGRVPQSVVDQFRAAANQPQEATA